MEVDKYRVRVDVSGTKFWYLNGNIHREDGSAIMYVDGYKEWHVNGKLHREGGPAIEYANDAKSWYVNGRCYSTEEYDELFYCNESIASWMLRMIKEICMGT